MLEISYKEIVQQKFEFKGFVAENFVQNEALPVVSRTLTHG